MGKLLRSVEELLQDRNEEIMRDLPDRESGRACFYCSERLSEKNRSGACKHHWNLLKKLRRRK